ncbi:FMN-binding protein [Rubripirellula sp.]|nr:FMN-binding protein [Rubripirellula sp.]
MNRSLPILSQKSQYSPWRLYLLHLLRLSMIVSLMVAIPRAAVTPRDGFDSPSIDQLIDSGISIPLGITIGAKDGQSRLWVLEDSQGNRFGWLARTFPDAQKSIGYRGPSEAIIVLDNELRIASVGLLSSDDTQEHIDAVKGDAGFFQQFEGWDWTHAPTARGIDGVSGATLTSLALAEGLALRMGGEVPSLIFNQPLDLAEAQLVFEQAASIDTDSGEVFDSENKPMGYVLRTGVYSDDLTGYQGPTELLIHLDEYQKISSVRIRKSFDNEPYVDYVRTEYGFWKIFRDMSLEQLSNFDPIVEGVEGVSGATMTSQNIAHTLVAAAKEHQRKLISAKTIKQSVPIRWSWRDIVTFVVLIVAAFAQTTRSNWTKRRRKVWLVTTVLVIGLLSGNLLSMALIAGWSSEGIAWRLAPGLATVAAFAFLFPILSKNNLYCNHLCPHGAMQQLVKPRKVSNRIKSALDGIRKWLHRLPGTLLLAAYLAIQLVPTLDLSRWEPFHAYLFRVSSMTAIGFAVGTVVVSRFLPMAYCRFGCPTGFILGYLRLNAKSGSLRLADGVVLVLALSVWSMRWIWP